MSQCQCLTRDGKGPQCSRTVKPGQQFCAQHQKCTHQIFVPITRVTKKQQTQVQEKPKIVPEKRQQSVWILMDRNNGQSHSAYGTRVRALQECLNILDKKYPGYSQDLASTIHEEDVGKPFDWTDNDTIEAIEEACGDRHYAIEEIPYFM